MKQVKLIFTILFIAIINLCIAQPLNWVSQFGGTSSGSEECRGVTIKDGYVYSTGKFGGTVDFDPGPGTHTIQMNGYGVFVTKQDLKGKLIWAVSTGQNGSTGNSGYDIEVDAMGNVYVVGTFQNTTDFDPGSGTQNLVSNGSRDVFVWKLDSSGAYEWAKGFGGTGIEFGMGIALDINNNILTTGWFQQTVDFDPGTPSDNITSMGDDDIFISKLDNQGNYLWAKSFSGTMEDRAYDIAVDSAGYIYTSGYFFSNPADFDPGTGTYNMSSPGEPNFISKLNSNGNFVWAKQFQAVYVYALTLDADWNILLGGVYSSSNDMDPGAGDVSMSAQGYDGFVSKLDSAGNYIWAKQVASGPSFDEEVAAIAVDDSNNVYITGKFRDSIDVNPGAGTQKFIAHGDDDIFISKLNSSGDFRWAQHMGGTDRDQGLAITVDHDGNVISGGFFGGSVDFDPDTTSFVLTSLAFWDAYVYTTYTTKKICSNTDTTIVQSACDSLIAPSGSKTFFTSGLYYDTIPNQQGCDSLITIDLSLGASKHHMDSMTSCIQYAWSVNGQVYTSTGIYTEHFTGMYGCDSNYTLDLSIKSVNIQVTQKGDTLIADADSADSYQWLDCDNGYNAIAGENNQVFIPSLSGNYAVEIGENTCTDTSICNSINLVGISNNSGSGMRIYPNPSPANFTLDFQGLMRQGNIIVRNTMGKLILKLSFSKAKQVELFIDDVPGIYFLEILADDHDRVVKKLIRY